MEKNINTNRPSLGRRALQAIVLAPALVLGFVGTAGAAPPTVDEQVIELATDQVPTMLLVLFGLAGATAVVAIAKWGVKALFRVFKSGGSTPA